jgi:DNA ligase-associated metallophosphoesterase
MHQYILHEVLGNHFILSSSRIIFWEEEKALILSDMHIGKSGHFRKNGIGIPQNIFKEDMQRLFAEIQQYNPTKLIIVGDLSHSHSNKEFDLFVKWRKDLPHLEVHLVVGNHDIMAKQWYEEASIKIHEDCLSIGAFTFTHDISTCETSPGSYYFSGHIHPGIIMRGLGKQSLRLPCFYFGKRDAVLPAFGKFTGTFPVNPQKHDTVFAIAENKLIRIQ